MTLDGVPRTEEVVKAQARYDRWKRVLMFACLLGTVLFSVTMLWMALEARETATRVENCTTPGRSCYEKQTGQLISDLEDLLAQQTQLQRTGSGTAMANQEILLQNQRDIQHILEILKTKDGVADDDPPATVPRPGTGRAAPSPTPTAAGPGAATGPSPATRPSPTTTATTSPPGPEPDPGGRLCILGICLLP